MGKSTGFKEWSRQDMGERDPNVRVRDWSEFKLALTEPELKRQGGRCMDCGVPFCQQGCPLGNLIPDWNDAIFQGDWRRAFSALQATNPLPEFTGRLCPAPCEGACVLGINDDPVSIEQLELAASERAFAEGWVRARTPLKETNRRVAVIGSGPAGLAAATLLREAGHAVTIFERDQELGGLLRYGIPDFKLEKWVIDRRIALLKEAGIQCVTGVTAGSDELPWRELTTSFDAIALCIGAPRPRDLNLPGRSLSGVHFAMDFLGAQNRAIAGEEPLKETLNARGKRVVILGGGDTGSDCLGTSLRQGATEVTQIELMPPPPTTRALENPWPQWPMIYRVSSSQAEGGTRRFSFMTERFKGEDGKLSALVGHEVEVSTSDGAPRFTPIGDELELPCDLALLALGFSGPDLSSLQRELSLELDDYGRLIVDKRGRASTLPVYAAGDARRGSSLIVWALSDGVEIARAIDQELSETSHIIGRGRDAPFV